MATVKSIEVPRNLPPAEQKKFISRAKRDMRIKARAKQTAENLMGVGIAAVSSYGYGVIEDKLPNEGKIPGTEIGFDLAGGIALTGAGAIMDSKMSSAMMFAGLGMLLPVLREYGRAATFF